MDNNPVSHTIVHPYSYRKVYEPKIVTESGELENAFLETDIESLLWEEFKCPICLEIIDKTCAVTACLHRFCSNCLHRSLRMELGPQKSHHECPFCRVKLASRRDSKPDELFDTLIAVITSSATIAQTEQSNESSNQLINADNGPSKFNLNQFTTTELKNAAQVHQKRVKDIAEISKYKRQKQEEIKATLERKKKAVTFSKLDMSAQIYLTLRPNQQWLEQYLDLAYPLISTDNYEIRKKKLLEVTQQIYIKAPLDTKVIDIKRYIISKNWFDEIDCKNLSLYIKTKDKEPILNEFLNLKDVIVNYWDYNSEFVLFYRFLTFHKRSHPSNSLVMTESFNMISEGSVR